MFSVLLPIHSCHKYLLRANCFLGPILGDKDLDRDEYTRSVFAVHIFFVDNGRQRINKIKSVDGDKCLKGCLKRHNNDEERSGIF